MSVAEKAGHWQIAVNLLCSWAEWLVVAEVFVHSLHGS